MLAAAVDLLSRCAPASSPLLLLLLLLLRHISQSTARRAVLRTRTHADSAAAEQTTDERLSTPKSVCR